MRCAPGVDRGLHVPLRMSVKTWGTSLLVVGAVAIGGARPAHACDPTLPVVGVVSPQQGAVVPTNPTLSFTQSGSTWASYRVDYQVQGSTTSQALTTLPDDAVDPNAPYSVALPIGAPGTQATVRLVPMLEGAQSREVTFTHGAQADLVAPATPLAPSVRLEHRREQQTGCGPIPEAEVVFVTLPAELDPDVVGFQVFSRLDGGLTKPATSLTLLPWGPEVPIAYYNDPSDVCVTLRLVDQAGNWSGPSEPSCLTVNGGCSSTRASGPPVAALAVLLGAGLLARRRRRSARG